MNLCTILAFILLLIVKFHSQITADQVVMSHSPLSMYHQLKNKHCLFAGQGQTIEIARHLGFTRITTIDMLNEMFPMLDVVDMSRRRKIASNQKVGESLQHY